MDATREQLYRAVCDDPDAEAPRRAMADWLVARGDPQGEFIRLQIESAKERHRYGRSVELARLSREADAVLEKHREEWFAIVASFQPAYFQFVHGFVELVQMDAREFLLRTDDLYRAAPIRQVALTNARPVIRELAASPALARIVSFAMNSTELEDEDLRTFLHSAHLGKLSRLDVSFNKLTDAGVEAICAASARVPKLASVNLRGNRRVTDPVEGYGVDGMSGIIVRDGIYLPDRGDELEAKFGPQAWLHAPSSLRNYPPTPDDFELRLG